MFGIRMQLVTSLPLQVIQSSIQVWTPQFQTSIVVYLIQARQETLHFQQQNSLQEQPEQLL